MLPGRYGVFYAVIMIDRGRVARHGLKIAN
jgi:hypothetical protein